LANKLITNNFDCNDPLINQYIISEQELTKYLNNPSLPPNVKEGISNQLYDNWGLNNKMVNTLKIVCNAN